MKKKLLMLALAAVMLLTALPAVSSAEAPAAPIAEEETAADLRELYVKEGLTALFTSLGEGAATVDMENGTWRDSVSGKTATLGNKEYWEKRSDGAVGFDILFGQLSADGSVRFAENGTPLTTDRYASGAPDTYAKTRLQLGLSFLPSADFTVEYLAKYNPIYVASADGSIAKNPDGSRMELFVKTGHGAPDAQNAGPADHIGFLSSFATERDGTYGSVLRDRGGILWCLTDDPTPTWDSPWIGLDSRGGGGMKGAFAVLGSIRTYAVTRDETRKENGDLTAVYELVRDRQSFKKSLAASTANTADGRTYYDKDDTGDFYLSSQTPTDFYAVRIYDRLLTEEEMEQNLLVDKMLYYGLKISPETLKDEAKMRVITAAVKREDFASDATAKAAKTAELQAIIDGEAYRADFASLFAAREHLTALFTTYIPGTLNLKDGVWTDLIKGEQAQLGNPQRWQRGEFGGVGFNTFCGEVIMGLAFTKESNNNNYAATGTKLNLGIELLPASDLTVDYLAMYKPVYVHDVQSEDGIARDADGNKLETYDFDPEATGLHLEKTPIDQIGWFSSYESSCDGIGYKPWGAAPRGSVHWLYDCSSWYSGNNGNWVGKKWTAAGGLNKLDDTLRRNKEIRTYSILLDETLTVAEDGTRTTTALFALYRDALFYNSNEAEEALNSTANGEGKDGYRDIDTVGTSGSFWLSATHPTDFFTVRVYNKALTEAELAHNRTADLLYYYGVTVPDSLYGNDAAMTALAAEISTLPFATDAAAIAANKALIESKLDAMKTPVPVTLNGKDAGTLTAIGSTLRLPERCDGKKAFAWRVNGTTYFSGATLTLSEGMTVAAITVDAPVTEARPTAYVTDKEAELGIRFAAAFSYAEYQLLLDTFGADAVKTGILITPRAYVNMANGVFTREALTAMVEASASVSRAAYVTVEAAPKQDGELARLAGVLYDFKQPTLEKNPHFTAIAYIDVDTNGDGNTDFTVYGENSPTVGATVRETLEDAREGLPARAQGWIDTLLGKFKV